MRALSDLWTSKAGLKTYAQAVREKIVTRYSEDRAKEWDAQTDPLKQTLSLDQMKELAQSEFGIVTQWDWDPARTYEGYYQIDKKLGVRKLSQLGGIAHKAPWLAVFFVRFPWW